MFFDTGMSDDSVQSSNHVWKQLFDYHFNHLFSKKSKISLSNVTIWWTIFGFWTFLQIKENYFEYVNLGLGNCDGIFHLFLTFYRLKNGSMNRENKQQFTNILMELLKLFKFSMSNTVSSILVKLFATHLSDDDRYILICHLFT